MKQVVFAVFLLAMASLTGCLNEEDSPVDEKTDTTDDSTSDTTEDNTDTTQDDTDTTDDTEDDELIDPMGQIPDESSIFIDNPYESDSTGSWECGGTDDSDYNCNFVYHGSDHFGVTESGSPAYFDADVVTTDFSFNGWVNKTGKTVTIKNLHFPEGDRYMKADYVNNTYCDGDWWEEEHYDEETGEYWYEQVYYEDCWTEEYTTFDYEYAGRPVSDDCNYNQHCEIVFYGHGGLVFNGKF
ncbi:uncharacterized protein METZ01_LOCUS366254, partial [marine metagenome]